MCQIHFESKFLVEIIKMTFIEAEIPKKKELNIQRICWCAPRDFKFNHFTCLFHQEQQRIKHVRGVLNVHKDIVAYSLNIQCCGVLVGVAIVQRFWARNINRKYTFRTLGWWSPRFSNLSFQLVKGHLTAEVTSLCSLRDRSLRINPILSIFTNLEHLRQVSSKWTNKKKFERLIFYDAQMMPCRWY